MFIQAGKHLIHAVSFGKGDTPFVAHGGWTGSWELWEQQFDVLSQERRCIAIDHLGSGESPIPAGESITLEMLVEDLKNVLDKLNVDKCILAGESSGTKAVLLFALLYPERVKGLVLVDGFASALPESSYQGSIDSMNKDYHAYLNGFVSACLPDTPAHLKRWGSNILKQSSKDDAIALMRLNSTVDLTERLAEINVPTLIIHGKKDVIIPLAASEQMAHLIPNSTLLVIPDSGHVPTISHLDEVVSEIQKFIGADLCENN